MRKPTSRSNSKKLGNFYSKQHVKLQQPQNYDFQVSQFNLRSQSGNGREMTTSPPEDHREAKLYSQRPPNYNHCEPTAVKPETQQLLPESPEILCRFMAVVVSSAIRKFLRIPGKPIFQLLAGTLKETPGTLRETPRTLR